MTFPSCCWKFPDFSSRLQTRPNLATIMRDEITRLWTNVTRLLARNIYLSSDLPPNKKLRIWAHNFRLARHPTTIRWEPPLASAPAVSKFGGIVLSQCGAACV
jgi:hypothetical protein